MSTAKLVVQISKPPQMHTRLWTHLHGIAEICDKVASGAEDCGPLMI